MLRRYKEMPSFMQALPLIWMEGEILLELLILTLTYVRTYLLSFKSNDAKVVLSPERKIGCSNSMGHEMELVRYHVM